MLEAGDKAEIKLTIIEGLKEGFKEHYERDHKSLKKTVDNHSKYFWWVQGAWATLLAWFKFGSH